MKNIFFTALTGFIFVFSGLASADGGYEPVPVLNTPVKQVIQYNSDGMLISKKKFDKKGNCVKIQYFSENKVAYETLSVYDAFGNIIDQTYSDDQGNFSGLSTPEFDGRGLLTKRTFYDDQGNITSSALYSFSDNGKMLSMTTLNAEGLTDYHYEYIYDNQGNLKEEKIFKQILKWQDGAYVKEPLTEENKELQYSVVRNYDDSGNMLKEEWVMPDGSKGGKSEYVYDEKGNVIKYTESGSDGTVYTVADVSYEYNANDNVIKMQVKISGEYDDAFAYTYSYK